MHTHTHTHTPHLSKREISELACLAATSERAELARERRSEEEEEEEEVLGEVMVELTMVEEVEEEEEEEEEEEGVVEGTRWRQAQSRQTSVTETET